MYAPPAPTGHDVVLRHGVATDLTSLVALHDRCTAATLRRRFHVPVTTVAERVVRQTLLPDCGWSVVAAYGEDLVGVASAGPLSCTDVEVGVLVEDAHQGAGIGSRLLRHVAAEATTRGYRSMLCLTERDNHAAQQALARSGLPAVRRTGDGLLVVTVRLQPPDAAPSGRRGSPRPVRARRGGSPRP